MVDPAATLGMCALNAALHVTRVLANRGLISPSDIEEIWDGVSQTLLDGGDERLAASMQATHAPIMAHMREVAGLRFKGEGVTSA